MRRFFVLSLALVATLGAENSRSSKSLASRVNAIVEHSHALARGHVGFKFVDADTGAILAERDASRFFTPASNTKLYTTALALTRLGANYRFRTQVATGGMWLAGQNSLPDLQLIGGGDPNLSGRTLPYSVTAPEGDPLTALKQMVDELADKGIWNIEGDVTGVSTRYGDELYPDGWTLDDSVYGYGAPVSALSLNDNTVAVIVRPSEIGELAEVELRPALPHFVLQNLVTTDVGNAAHVTLSRIPGSNELILSGTIGQRVDQWREDAAVEDGALFAAEAFVDLLREHGIRVGGAPHAVYGMANAPARGTILSERMSQPLSEVVQVVNKVSQNLHAEMLLREVAAVRSGVGSLDNGRKEREAFLAEAGVTREGTGYALDDGSGLARQDLTTAESTVALLRYMWARPDHDAWVNSLPIGNRDGSLEHRFRKTPGAERIRAKTGSLSHVNTLSGYIETRAHRCIAFSVMVNATGGHEKDVRDAIDQLCAAFLSL